MTRGRGLLGLNVVVSHDGMVSGLSPNRRHQSLWHSKAALKISHEDDHDLISRWDKYGHSTTKD